MSGSVNDGFVTVGFSRGMQNKTTTQTTGSHVVTYHKIRWVIFERQIKISNEAASSSDIGTVVNDPVEAVVGDFISCEAHVDPLTGKKTITRVKVAAVGNWTSVQREESNS